MQLAEILVDLSLVTPSALYTSIPSRICGQCVFASDDCLNCNVDRKMQWDRNVEAIVHEDGSSVGCNLRFLRCQKMLTRTPKW